MHTIDIHTHLLNPAVRFQRPIDRFTLRFFARNLGADPGALRAAPYPTYVDSMASAIRDSKHIDRVCLLGVDCRVDERGRQTHRDPTVCAMSEDVLAVARRYPDQFIPFLSVNPRRPDALERLDELIERGCRGAKFLQNYWGVDLNDRRFIPYYERLVARGIPLIIHIGSEYAISSDTRFEGVSMLELPLACGVKVIAAHMGLGRIEHRLLPWRNLSREPRHFDRDYHRLLEMLRRHDNLYADIAAILAPLRARALRHLSQQRDIHHKLLFGTDYPVPFLTRFNRDDLGSETHRAIAAIANPFDRYAAVILNYFPEGSPIYDNHRKLLGTVA